MPMFEGLHFMQEASHETNPSVTRVIYSICLSYSVWYCTRIT